ncbi:ATP-binding cassette domain-containing protein [Actinoallomurus rhizosphaericola]|uniref:ATP-binding cassette domain-containing protein n=1 Tax=Actinoallomurus rhizosphaericola TaxID=2952536 RepID=UPI002093507D|nr:ATP-binding cassette domain-containing protein [Actinoallomurus rhizosphaericola]MCO5995695.1 ATP-binding cassette domain-containing protein [Actinoallomurus rhizosphaericola]
MIDVRELTERYGSRYEVRDLSFIVEPGKVTGFLGSNGSGRSTTMRTIMGLGTLPSGPALINGQPYGQLRWPLRGVGALLKAKAIRPSRSADNHLWMRAQTNGAARRRVGEVIDMVGHHRPGSGLTMLALYAAVTLRAGPCCCDAGTSESEEQ